METTENRILAAAEEEFMLKGFAGAKTVAIAERAGVTHAMLHYYFRTKERLFQQVYTKKVEALGNSLIEAFTTPGRDFKARIRAGIALHFDFLAANPTLPRFIINEIVANPNNREAMIGNLSKLLAHITAKMQHEIDEQVAKGEISPINIPDLLLDIVSLNAFPFFALPAVEQLFAQKTGSLEGFLEHRKQENIEIIMRRLTPTNKKQL